MRVCVCVCTDQHESGALATGSLLVLIELAMLVCDCLSHCVVALRVIKANDLWGAGPAMIDGHSRAHQGLAEGQQCRRQMPWEGGGVSQSRSGGGVGEAGMMPPLMALRLGMDTDPTANLKGPGCLQRKDRCCLWHACS